MAQIMGEELGEYHDCDTRNLSIKEELYRERIRKDLEQKTYQVPLATFEKWYKKGFRAEKGEFDVENMSPERKKRYSDMGTGSALRK